MHCRSSISILKKKFLGERAPRPPTPPKIAARFRRLLGCNSKLLHSKPPLSKSWLAPATPLGGEQGSEHKRGSKPSLAITSPSS